MSETRGLLNAREAADYLGVSRATFFAHIRSAIRGEINVAPPSSQRRMPRWTVADLDAWAATRRHDRKSA